MIEIKDVEFISSGNSILKSINLTIKEQRVGIVGANGSGKSTLGKLIKGLFKPSTGKIFFKGMDIHTNNIKNKIGYVFQDPDNQIIMPIVEEDIALGLRRLGLSKGEIMSKVKDILCSYKLEKLIGKTTYHLSGGEKQLIAIAGVLAMEPEMIIFDEPTTLLDLRNRNRIQTIINKLSKPIILVTHDLNLLDDFDRVLILDNGEIIADHPPQEAIQFYVRAMSKEI